MWVLESIHCKGENINGTREARQQKAGLLHRGLLREVMMVEKPVQRTREGKSSLKDGRNDRRNNKGNAPRQDCDLSFVLVQSNTTCINYSNYIFMCTIILLMSVSSKRFLYFLKVEIYVFQHRIAKLHNKSLMQNIQSIRTCERDKKRRKAMGEGSMGKGKEGIRHTQIREKKEEVPKRQLSNQSLIQSKMVPLYYWTHFPPL